jgi:hypothetical protein
MVVCFSRVRPVLGKMLPLRCITLHWTETAFITSVLFFRRKKAAVAKLGKYEVIIEDYFSTL